jgi:hypothetical protein
MTPEERELIEGVFERMRSVGTIDKDREAEAHINSSVRQIRDSAYMLVQTVIVQDQALQQADERIRELEDMVNQLQAAQDKAKQSSGGSFLGGLFGGSKPAPAAPQSSPWGGSVPPVGRQSAGYAGPAQSSSPWGNPQPQAQPQGYGQPQMQAPQSSGGGFMRSAMATAAGVAGGVLVAGAIGNMMRGGHGDSGAHSASGDGATPLPSYQDANSNDQGGVYSNEPQYQDAASNDQGTSADDTQDAGYDDGGSDWGGGDIET